MTDPRSTARGTPDRDTAGPDSLERPKGRPSRHNARWEPAPPRFSRSQFGYQSLLPQVVGFRVRCAACGYLSGIYPTSGEAGHAQAAHNRLRT